MYEDVKGGAIQMVQEMGDCAVRTSVGHGMDINPADAMVPFMREVLGPDKSGNYRTGNVMMGELATGDVPNVVAPFMGPVRMRNVAGT